MAKSMSYVDAARLLGGGDDHLLARLNALAGGVLVAVSPAAFGVLALLDAKVEVARLGQDLVRRLRERRAGLGRYDRTQRLAAAHTVLVVAAYFEALADADLPWLSSDLGLTRFEEIAIAGQTAVPDSGSFVGELLAVRATLPEPQVGHEVFTCDLEAYYRRLSSHMDRFLSGLAVWDAVSELGRRRWTQVLDELPGRAVRRYSEHLRALAADFGEVATWVNLVEHQATRGLVRALEPSLGGLERQLVELSSGIVPEVVAGGVSRSYRAALHRPIAESGDFPPNVAIPTLAESYLAPPYRVSDAEPTGNPSNEGWWESIDVRHDLDDFLLGYLTSMRATEAPILVLGQPGAGKSVLTRVLAARLPAADFLALRVPLRDVAAEFDLQGQIEQAIHQATGERIGWPSLVRSHPSALPVVLIDGFDEMLQTTGVRQTDYLIRVADFQRREAEQGRPVAVLVTTRTSVADRARTPTDTLLLRLEPFDQHRIEMWVKVWNATNASNFESAGIQPLDARSVLSHAELAGQPLLLLLLALYDADGNALERLGPRLERTDLYEQLLTSFARREVTKDRPNIASDEVQAAVEQELRQLSIVAFAMFNRASQWVSEDDLELDLTAMFGPRKAPTNAGLRSPMRSAELTLGRFFFVHRSQAQRDEASLHTFEFLHATFGEFLVARLTWQVALDTMAREHLTTLPTGGIDDELLYALLSFVGVVTRRPVVEFLVAFSATLPEGPRQQLSQLLIRLFRSSGEPRAGRAFDSYRPRRLTVSARHAAYSANLFILTLAVRGTSLASEIFDSFGGSPVDQWRRLIMLWQSQLTDEFYSMVSTVALERLWRDGRREARLFIDYGTTMPAPIDLAWTHGFIASPRENAYVYLGQLALYRRVNFLCRGYSDAMLNALDPVLQGLGPYAFTRFRSVSPDDIMLSDARAFIEAWLLPFTDADPESRRSAYLRCAALCVRQDGEPGQQTDHKIGSDTEQDRLSALLLSAITADPHADDDTVMTVLETLLDRSDQLPPTLSTKSAELALDRLSRSRSTERRERLIQIVGQLVTTSVEP